MKKMLKNKWVVSGIGLGLLVIGGSSFVLLNQPKPQTEIVAVSSEETTAKVDETTTTQQDITQASETETTVQETQTTVTPKAQEEPKQQNTVKQEQSSNTRQAQTPKQSSVQTPKVNTTKPMTQASQSKQATVSQPKQNTQTRDTSKDIKWGKLGSAENAAQLSKISEEYRNRPASEKTAENKKLFGIK